MSEIRRALFWATAAALASGSGSAWAGGGHGRQAALGVGGYTVGSPVVVLGAVPERGVLGWHKWHTVGAVGVAPGTAPPLGLGYVMTNAGNVAGTMTAPSLGATWTYYALTPGGATAAGGSTAPSLGAGGTGDPEVRLGAALSSAGRPGDLQRIKDRIRQLLEEQTRDGRRPRRSRLIRFLTDAAMTFARDQLRLDLIHWLPDVRDLVTRIVSDEAGGSEPGLDDEAAEEAADRPVSPASDGRRVIPIRASGYLVIDRITIDGRSITIPETPGGTTTPNTPEGGTTPAGDVTGADTGPLLPNEGND